MTIKVKPSINFEKLYDITKQYNYIEEQNKMIQLYEKWSNKSMVIGFTGHFSAGKSSMINEIVGEELLPSSPIPTSANIVEIQNGQEQVTYYFNKTKFAKEPEVNIDQIQRFSRNGEEVESLTIEKSLPFIQDITLMDTPGIDSADDEEFNRTLSRVHLIDYFVYVVDYNHVQSEVNFLFLNELEKKSVPYMIVVNQIDKHNSTEITMESYRHALVESCDNWGLNPDLILYTSLKELNHPENQLHALQQHIDNLIQNKVDYVEKRVMNELNDMITQVAEKQFGEYDHISKEQLELNEQQYYDLKSRIDVLNKTIDQFKAYYSKSIGKLVDESYLMTFEIREAAKQYLESLQPKFKVGGLFSKKKTAEEKEQRSNQFIHNLNERVKTEVNWHVRDFLMKTIEDNGVQDQDLKKQVQQFEYVVTEEALLENVNPSAEVNGDYVLLFTNLLQKSIASNVKQQLSTHLAKLHELLQLEVDQQLPQLNEQLSELEMGLNQSKQSIDQSQEIKRFESTFKKALVDEYSNNETVKAAYQDYLSSYHQVEIEDVLSEEIVKNSQEVEVDDSSYQPVFSVDEVKRDAERILNSIKEISILDHYERQIRTKNDQINDMSYTVALFGAFSAGKSSFANAWVGDYILPVSPNPTTAAINKISPVNEQYQHEDVVVSFKTEKSMINQVNQIIAPITDETFQSVQALKKFIQKNIKKITDQLSKMDVSFVQAFLNGLSDCESLLGDQKQITIQDFRQYVTEESLSCFVEEIVIYYDCELTRSGVTLVDTPGADSIHARHTNVSMHYVKHSDVLVYVNYYNHAFARADREFLKQLGRVKDAFTMDKMFFVLNASDLASSRNELKMVESYLQDQLQQHGIHNPQTYPISSKRLIEQPALKQEDEQALSFFGRFNHFIEHDAKAMLTYNLKLEVDALTSFVHKTVNEIDQNQEEQDRLIAQYKQEQEQLRQYIESVEPTVYVKQIQKQVDELTHYVHERTNIQLMDLMKDVINPATITQNGKKGQEELRTALKQLFIDLKKRVEKEYQSTNILLDYHFNQVGKSFIGDLNHYVEKNTQFDQVYFEEQSLDNATQPNFMDVNDQIDLKELVSLYKNKKEFFEQNKIKDLFSQLEKIVDEYLASVVTQFKHAFEHHYANQFEQYQQEETSRYLELVYTLIHSKQSIYQDETQKSKLKQLDQMLSD
ncbi:dynamin family protein [Alkalibacillus silvisoli]|uniref:Dynamin family protein n=1 Tax=Alkalibacillus silvisoli TaxID=392823 RepID=A0ABN0ZUH3_9BACI